MSTDTTSRPSLAQRFDLPTPTRWHRPLLVVASLMGALAVLCLGLAIVDPREILGQNAWFKPLKFSLSIGIYALTLAWMIGMLSRFRRAGWVAGTVTAVALLVEQVIIVGAAALGTTSHFNVATPLNSTLWSVMAASISIVWAIELLVGGALFLSPIADAARRLAVRAGVVLGGVGMGLAFLMTGPAEGQIEDFQGVIGAHAVGVRDGGPGLPFLGWSIDGGDLRVPHFIGMHLLQALPLLVLALELLSRRIPLLRDRVLRVRIVVVATVVGAAALALLTAQALLGQSVIAPAGPVLAGGIVLAVGGTVALAAVVLVAVRSRRAPGGR